MSYRLGVNCHIILSHIGIDGGAEFGFLVDPQQKLFPEGVRINRQVVSDGTTTVWVHADILLADDLVNPDGSPHADDRAQMYAKLLQFLDKRSGITVETPAGALINLGALAYCADERHTPAASLVRVILNNAGVYWPPVDADLLSQSLWDGALTWNTSYWR